MQDFDVVIVGLGPVGGTGAILLAHAGLSIAVIEKDVDIHPLPRAVAMDGEVIRAFQAIGKGEELDTLRQPIRPGERAGFVNSKHEWLFGQDLETFSPAGWAPVKMFDQPEFDAYLREIVSAHPNITVFLGSEAESISQDDNSVTVTARNSNGDRFECVGKYLIGCDGASSLARRHIGAKPHDLGYNQDWLVVDVVVNEGADLPTGVLQVCDPDRIATYVCVKDPNRRWEFRLNDGETREDMLRDEAISALIDPWTPPDTYEIRRAAVYQFHALNADRWRDGRIFIAGDAAHQTPPFLGQGMNAGIRDAVNLAWKLPLVIRGDATDRLLDTYQEERATHAEDLVDWAVGIGKLMEYLAASEAASRGDGPPPGEAPAMSAGYGQGRMVPPLRDGILLREQVAEDGSTGFQLDQPIIKDASGREARLDDKIGSGFAIVARDASNLDLSTASQAICESLRIQIVDLSEYEVVQGNFDPVFQKANAVLLRPDRYVFGHTTDALSLNALIEKLGEKLQLRAAAHAM